MILGISDNAMDKTEFDQISYLNDLRVAVLGCYVAIVYFKQCFTRMDWKRKYFKSNRLTNYNTQNHYE